MCVPLALPWRRSNLSTCPRRDFTSSRNLIQALLSCVRLGRALEAEAEPLDIGSERRYSRTPMAPLQSRLYFLRQAIDFIRCRDRVGESDWHPVIST